MSNRARHDSRRRTPLGAKRLLRKEVISLEVAPVITDEDAGHPDSFGSPPILKDTFQRAARPPAHPAHSPERDSPSMMLSCFAFEPCFVGDEDEATDPVEQILQPQLEEEEAKKKKKKKKTAKKRKGPKRAKRSASSASLGDAEPISPGASSGSRPRAASTGEFSAAHAHLKNGDHHLALPAFEALAEAGAAPRVLATRKKKTLDPPRRDDRSSPKKRKHPR